MQDDPRQPTAAQDPADPQHLGDPRDAADPQHVTESADRRSAAQPDERQDAAASAASAASQSAAAPDGQQDPAASRPGRRGMLIGGAAAGGAVLGAAALAGADAVLDRVGAPSGGEAAPLMGATTIPFHGEHQAGIETPPAAHATFVSLDLRPGAVRDDVIRMLRILTDDAARLTAGRGALADTEPELAEVPASLTITVGFGPALVRAAEREVPTWLAPLPAFGIDRLEPTLCDGDLLLQVSADEPHTVAHAVRMLLKDLRAFADLRWTQQGFRQAHGSVKPGTTMRNLLGQVDGTVNPQPGEESFRHTVWIPDGPWAGGTSMVLRRIAMDLDTWDELDRPGRELAIGRRLDTGAPLTGTAEHDEPDFDKLGPNGFAVIPEFSHMRRARGVDSPNGGQTILRRPYSYDEPAGAGAGAISSSGLIFVAFQASVLEQFVPMQRRLDELDLLSTSTTPIGSAVFGIPPGCAEGEFIGEAVLG